MNIYIKMRSFFESRIFMLATFVLSACFVIFEKEAYGAIILLNVGAVALLFSENILSAFTPALLACSFVIKCYDSAELFFPLWWTALFPIAAIIAYLIVYRRKITIGKSFGGIVAVAVAVTLGGLFTISPSEYFSGASLYYVLMLGFGMVAAYLLLRSHIVETDRYDIFGHFADMMVAVGAFASFVVLEYYAKNLSTTLLVSELADVQWSNNVATILMITMPFALYKMKDRIWFLSLFLVNYAALLLAASRGGWIMGTVEFLICVSVGVLAMNMGKAKRIALVILGALFMCVAVVAVVRVSDYWDGDLKFLPHDDVRIRLFARSFEDFMENPVFGKGLGNTANSDLYNGKKGTMTWYHMMIPQIVGSLGLVGMFCYGKQMVERFAMIFRKPDAYVWTLGLSYIGIFLMSQVNPGEFCPLPYELLTVITFIMIEKYNEKRESAIEADSLF